MVKSEKEKMRRAKAKPNLGSNRERSKVRTTKSPAVSACMIVKNEEEQLPQCLDSVKDVVDEIIITDTGLTDRTVEIVENYGARVILLDSEKVENTRPKSFKISAKTISGKRRDMNG